MARFAIQSDPATGRIRLRRTPISGSPTRRSSAAAKPLHPALRGRLWSSLAGFCATRWCAVDRARQSVILLTVLLLAAILGGLYFAVHQHLVERFPWMFSEHFFVPLLPALAIYFAFIGVATLGLYGRGRS